MGLKTQIEAYKNIQNILFFFFFFYVQVISVYVYIQSISCSVESIDMSLHKVQIAIASGCSGLYPNRTRETSETITV